VLGIGCDFEQRLRARLEEEPEENPLVLPDQWYQRMRHAEKQMVVVHGQQFAFSPDGRFVASGDFLGTVKIWSTSTWLTVQTLSTQGGAGWHGRQSDAIASRSFNSAGNLLLAATSLGRVKLWEAPVRKEVADVRADLNGSAETWTLSPDGRTLAIGTIDGYIKFRSAFAREAFQTFPRARAPASKCITQALLTCSDCVAALVAQARYHLFIHRIAEAKEAFDRALALNPRTPIHKELGWLCLESGNYSQAISLFTDHLQRHSADYEAFNLLLECCWRTGRYEAGMRIAQLMVDEGAPSDCFENNGLVCAALLGLADEGFLKRLRPKAANPFVRYTLDVTDEAQENWKSQLLFQNYRHGIPNRKENTLTIEQHGRVQEWKDPLITIGRTDSNRLCLADTIVSRRHCVVVNSADDVWIYDVGSTHGVFLDGKRIERKAYLQGVHVVKFGQTELTICSKLGLLV
jgi:tetratricopeptide (TPR) repeat protein